MRIALGLPSRVAGASGELIHQWAVAAERGPFSSLVVTDRVVSQALEPLAVLAVAAGATRRIRLMTSVVIGPAPGRHGGRRIHSAPLRTGHRTIGTVGGARGAHRRRAFELKS